MKRIRISAPWCRSAIIIVLHTICHPRKWLINLMGFQYMYLIITEGLPFRSSGGGALSASRSCRTMD